MNCIKNRTEEEIRTFLLTYMNKSRMVHTLNVVEAAKELACRYGVEEEPAVTVAYLHDILKEKQPEWLTEFILSHGENPGESLLAPQTLHAHAGALFAEHICGIKDRNILDAIHYHTTGRENMSLYEKILFVADYIEKGRIFQGVDAIRTLAFKDIDEALYAALDLSIAFLTGSGSHVISVSFKARDYYRVILQGR